MPALPLFGGLGVRAARGFAVRRVRLDAGSSHAYEPTEWRRALVVVERGRLELEWRGGARLGFAAGDVLCLDGLDLVALRSAGAAPTRLLVVKK